MEGLLLVGHGSRDATGPAEVRALGRRVAAALPGVAVDVGFLELSEPPAGPVLDGLVAGGCRRVVVLPLVLLGAGHAKSDVPAVVLEARDRHPGVELRFGSPLGVTRDLVEAAGRAVAAAGGAGLPLLVVARGTSDPDANGDACKATRLVAEWSGAPFSHTGFTGVTTPAVPEALDVFARQGHDRVAVFFWFLGHGRLVERARAEAADFTARTGVDVVDAGYFGPDAAVVAPVVERYRRALAGAGGVPAVNCDLCAYRAPWPGREERVAQPVGVGHSHLALEHRRHAHPPATGPAPAQGDSARTT